MSHDSTFAGHMGRDKTLDACQRLFYWQNMDATVAKYVQECHVCQTSKASTTGKQGLLQPIETAEKCWHNISFDLITDLPTTTSGQDCILVVVDRCSKMVRLIPTDKTVNAVDFAKLMVDNIFTKFGWPVDAIHDRDLRFTAGFFQDCCIHWKLKQSMTSAFHPQSDGQTERMNRTIEQCLRAFTAEHHTEEWDDLLSMVEFAMNNSKSASLQQTPFFMVYGEHPLTPLACQLMREDKNACSRALQFNQDRKEAFDYAMTQLKIARDRYKSYKDAHLKDVQFQVGEKVLLSTVNLNKHNYNRKLFPKYIGPF